MHLQVWGWVVGAELMMGQPSRDPFQVAFTPTPPANLAQALGALLIPDTSTDAHPLSGRKEGG